MGKQKEKEDNRKLTKAEQKRKEQFELLKGKMESEGYEQEDLTIGITYANVMSIVLCLPIVILLAVPYMIVNEGKEMTWSSPFEGLLVLAAFFVLIVVHELIHGITWAHYAPSHWKSVSFGFMVQYLTPYCTCNEPLKKNQYIIGALMPTIILGIIPAIVSIIMGSWLLFALSALMIFGGGGDLTIVLKLLRYREKEGTIFVDHPYQCGLVAFVRK